MKIDTQVQETRMNVCFKFHGNRAMRLAVRMKQSRRLLVQKKTQELQSQSFVFITVTLQ